jgi:hypothetical protein
MRDLNLGKITRISVTDLYGLTEKIVREALNKKDGDEEDVMYYTSVLREIQDLEAIRSKQREIEFQEGKEEMRFDRTSANRVNFTENDFHRHIEYISTVSSPFIEIEIVFDNKTPNELNKEIEDLLQCFSQDDFFEKTPTYKPKRYYFTKQIENFFEYIKTLPEIDSYINIPFSILREQGFEAIKILSYLEKQGKIKVRNWNDTEFWNVKFHKTPVTLNSLLGQDKIEIGNEDNIEKIKLTLSFSLQTGTMILIDTKGKEYRINVQGQVQREVLRVIFQHPKNTYSEWSLYDISETLGGNDVNEIAVKNAIYQFNRKVKLSIPEVENIFELTKHSAKLNSKYVNKN